MSRTIAYDRLVEQLADRVWRRMTRTITPYAALNEHDQAACRALIEPVLRDVIDIAATRVTDSTFSERPPDLAHIVIELNQEAHRG